MTLNPIIGKSYDFVSSIVSQAKFPANRHGAQESLASKSELNAIKALSGYAKREGIFGAIATLLHRIWNAAKAIFGQSDWQRAQKAVISIGQRILPHADQLFKMGKDEALILQFLMQSQINTPQFKEKISETFERILKFLNIANRDLKLIEEKMAPRIDKILNSYETSKIASDILKTKYQLSISELLEKNEQITANLEQDLIPNFLSFATNLCGKGYLKQKGLNKLEKLVKSKEMSKLMKSIPEVVMIVFGIGLYFDAKPEVDINSFSASSTSSEGSDSSSTGFSFEDDTTSLKTTFKEPLKVNEEKAQDEESPIKAKKKSEREAKKNALKKEMSAKYSFNRTNSVRNADQTSKLESTSQNHTYNAPEQKPVTSNNISYSLPRGGRGGPSTSLNNKRGSGVEEINSTNVAQKDKSKPLPLPKTPTLTFQEELLRRTRKSREEIDNAAEKSQINSNIMSQSEKIQVNPTTQVLRPANNLMPQQHDNVLAIALEERRRKLKDEDQD